MIDGNVIKFGYGTVGVSFFLNFLKVYNVEPPHDIGKHVLREFRKESICIDMSKHYAEMMQQLAGVYSGKQKLVEVGKYILDFTNFNKRSVDIVSDYAHSAYLVYTSLLAV